MIAPYSLSQVRLLPGPCLDAQRTDVEYLLSLDPQRLLAPIRREAGMPPAAAPYPNWESMGLDGHTLGHAMSAAARLSQATDDPRLRPFLDQLVDGVDEAQRAGGDGYVGGVPEGRELWKRVGAEDVAADSFGLNGAWVPWYNLHKLVAGLIDAFRFAGSDTALALAVRFADWWASLAARLDDAAHERMLDTEFGGMCEALADLAVLAERPDIAALARRFLHHRLLDPLLDGEDALTGMHANTQIAKAVGYQRLGEIEHDEQLLGAARFFWETVVRDRTYSFGGNSISEHFTPVGDSSGALASPEGPETCNTTNMLKLSRALWLSDGDAEVIDYYERATYNHILSSQRPSGGFVYFTPVRPDHYRVYSSAQSCFWCCVGTGLENHAKYGELVWARHGDDILLNLGIASQFDDAERGITLRQTCTATRDDALHVDVVAAPGKPFALSVRQPSWAVGSAELALNGRQIEASTVRIGTTSYLRVERNWSVGDALDITMPRTITVETMPGDSAWVSFVRGPVVLAARTSASELHGLEADDSRMGHVASGPLRPLASTPVLLDEPLRCVHEQDGAGVRLSAHAPDSVSLTLEPFASMHDTRYSLYFPRVGQGRDANALLADLREQDASVVGRSEGVIDTVAAGQQQPEVSHGFRSGTSRAGFGDERWWRTTTDWFSYELATGGSPRPHLVVTYLAGGAPTQVSVDGVAVLTLDGDGPVGDLRIVDVELSPASGAVTVVFRVQSEATSVRVVECRIEK